MRRSAVTSPAGYPLHPLLAGVAVGAFVSSLIFDILTRTRTNGLPYLVDAAWWLIEVGIIAALIAAVPGVVDLLAIPRRTPAFAVAVRHLVLNAVSLVLFAIDFVWRADDHLDHDKTPWGQLALSGAATAPLAAACWLGLSLTYRHGVGVRPRDEPQRT